jgi:hypothetical protein
MEQEELKREVERKAKDFAIRITAEYNLLFKGIDPRVIEYIYKDAYMDGMLDGLKMAVGKLSGKIG